MQGLHEFNKGVNEFNKGVNRSVARQGCNLLRAAVTSAVTSQGYCCGNLQIHSLDLGQILNHLTLNNEEESSVTEEIEIEVSRNSERSDSEKEQDDTGSESSSST